MSKLPEERAANEQRNAYWSSNNI